MSDLVLIDIDGVVSDDSHRTDLAIQQRWDEYFDLARVDADKLLPEGKDLVEAAWAGGALVMFLTGRREDLRDVTEAWLSKHGLHADAVLMRPFDEHCSLPVFKARIVASMAEDYERVQLYDDDPRVVASVNGLEIPHVTAFLTKWYVKPQRLVDRALS